MISRTTLWRRVKGHLITTKYTDISDNDLSRSSELSSQFRTSAPTGVSSSTSICVQQHRLKRFPETT